MTRTERLTPDSARLILSDGATVAARRWGPPRDRRMVISHGTGLAIEGFRDFGEALQPEFEVIAFDMRNHGASGPGTVLPDPWARFLRDMPEIFDGIEAAFGPKPTHGAFHSLSAATTLIAQGQNPRAWQSLSLFEPPIPPAPDPAMVDRFAAVHMELARRTRARRRSFDGPERLVASFRKSPTFGGIEDAALLRLARAVMHRTDADPDAPWELVLDPEMEANTYDTRDIGPYWEGLKTVDCPVQILLGSVMGHDMPLLIETATYLARSFGYVAATVAGGGHLMQMQRPLRSAELVTAFADTVSAAQG